MKDSTFGLTNLTSDQQQSAKTSGQNRQNPLS